MPAIVDPVTVYAGDTAHWPVYTIKNSDNTTRNLVAEGWADWVAQWRPNDISATDIPLNVDISRANEGTLIITSDPDDTRAMGGNGVWDIQSTNTITGEVKTWLRGKTKWSEDVTRV